MTRTLLALVVSAAVLDGCGSSSSPGGDPSPDGPRRPVAVGVGRYHSCVLSSSGEVACWGFNGDGQLGAGSAIEETFEPVSATSLSGATAMASAAFHVCAADDGGAVRCWGNNTHGQIGDGSFTDRFEPRLVASVAATALAAGGDHSCAAQADGGVRCWGYNYYAQLGNAGVGTGTGTSHSATAVAVAGISTATAVAAGEAHGCALLQGGAVKCWGANVQGQLGRGTTGSPSVDPAEVTSLSGATEIAAGAYHTCAIVAGGAVKCWGYGLYGQIGNGATAQASSTPTFVTGLTGATALGLGFRHTCAVVAGGEIRCWGRNNTGQLGDGTRTDRATPVAVSNVSGAIAVAAAENHTCAALDGGGVKCWGMNEGAQLGVDPAVVTSSNVAVDAAF